MSVAKLDSFCETGFKTLPEEADASAKSMATPLAYVLKSKKSTAIEFEKSFIQYTSKGLDRNRSVYSSNALRRP